MVTVVKNFSPVFLAKQRSVHLQSMGYYKQSAFVNLPVARGQRLLRYDGLNKKYGLTVILIFGKLFR